jgi:hypothetical protein
MPRTHDDAFRRVESATIDFDDEAPVAYAFERYRERALMLFFGCTRTERLT